MTDALTEGQTAPDFNLPADGEGTLSLTDYKGQPVIVYFYPKDDTPGCTKEAIAFTEKQAEFEALGITIIGISPDNAKKHDRFKAKHALTIRLAADEETETAQAYGVWVEKKMYGKTYMGVERSTFLIDHDGKLAHIWRKVKVPGHVDDVLEKAKTLL